MLKLRPLIFILFWVVLLLLVRTTQAHDEFEITSTARLQHNRLEVGVIMTLRAGGALLEESSNPEFELRPDNFESHRGQLQTAAMRFFEIADGQAVLSPIQASVALPEPGHVRFTVVYPQPSSWPLKFRPGKMGHMPASTISDLGVYDQTEKLLGTSVLRMGDSAASELSVTPRAAVSSPAPEPPVMIPPVNAAPEQPPTAAVSVAASPQPSSWSGIALGLTLGLGTLLLIPFLKKRKTFSSPSP